MGVYSTQHSPTLLIPSILSCANKRSYPAYTYQRRNDIWLSRKALIEYEEALALEARVDGILESVGTGVVRARSWSVASKTPARQTRTTSASTGNVKISVKGKEKENLLLDDDELAMAMNQDDDVITESPRMQNARLVKEILEVAFPRWKDLVQTKGQEGGRPSGLERFDCGAPLILFVHSCIVTIRPSRACLYTDSMQRRQRAGDSERIQIRTGGPGHFACPKTVAPR